MTEQHSEEGRALLQQRLGFFAKTLFALLGAVWIVATITLQIFPTMRPTTFGLDSILALAGVIALLGVWLVARRGVAYSVTLLLVVDGSIMLGAGAILATAVSLYSTNIEHVLLPSVIPMLLTFGRVIMVPSTPRRTVIFSAAACGPLLAAQNIVMSSGAIATMLPRPVFLSGGVTLVTATIVLAAVGSQVIYGLRAQVREARQLGQYTLLEKIGEGGMGAVYKARHAMLRRPTAIKLLPPDRLGAASLERFEREVQLTSELTHPNTIAIYDYGRSADGVFYYAMEYLDGVDLDTLVSAYGPQPQARVVHILVQAAGALAEAHARGLIHRDIKPANMILCERGHRADVVKVVDFGLVKELARDRGVTGIDIVTGTPGYIAPEAITAPDDVGAAADLYALGAVAYFLLSGKPVFSGATIAEVCAHHVHSVPERLAELCADPVDGVLEALIMRCLAKKPNERPESAAALGAELARLALEPWTDAQAVSWWREHQDRREAHVLGSAATIAMAVDLQAR